ncbi:hypothetical protein [Flavobacterium sp.]|uniref:hypothetical protein n=1 Tax=Flavobacterium sp. TaxID=239 RepID=UPI002631D02D|nr:hypothetical protein [Flavobacterium sp.]
MNVQSPLIAFSNPYFQLTRNCLEELIKSGNSNYLRTNFDENISKEDSDFALKEKTKWSDYNVIQPILFNFYHSLELLMKGIIVLKNGKNSDKSHNLEKLFFKVSKIGINSPILLEKLEKYCLNEKGNNNPISKFLKTNDEKPSNYIHYLKYPFNLDNKIFKYNDLRNLKQDGIEMAKEIMLDIDIIRNEISNI